MKWDSFSDAKIWRTVLFIIAVVSFVSAAFLAFKGDVGGAATIYGANIMVLIFIFLESFKSFKGFGVEAQLAEKIKEADDVIVKLRGILGVIASFSVSSSVRLGRIGTALTVKERFEMVNSISIELKKCGIHDGDIINIIKEYHYYNMFDVVNYVVSKITGRLVNKKSALVEKNRNKRDANLSEIDLKRTSLMSKAIDDLQQLRNIVDRSNVGEWLRGVISDENLFDERERSEIMQEVSELIAEAEFYEKNKKFKNITFVNDMIGGK